MVYAFMILSFQELFQKLSQVQVLEFYLFIVFFFCFLETIVFFNFEDYIKQYFKHTQISFQRVKFKVYASKHVSECSLLSHNWVLLAVEN